jgi:hypothetical protein
MTMTPSSTAGLAVEKNSALARMGRIAQQNRRPQRLRPLMRRYDVAYLTPSQEIKELARPAPAISAFEDAFAAFGRGTIFETEFGPTAVEDLLPGDKVMTQDAGLQVLKWVGRMTLIPDFTGQSPEMGKLTRVTADRFGLGKPMHDLVLGPRARMLYKSPSCQVRLGTDGASVPLPGFIDGVTIFEVTPVTPVKTFHLCFDKHHTLVANGILLESFHPGRTSDLALSIEMQQLYLSLFPQIKRIEDFGPMKYPRLSAEELDSVRAA